LIIKSPDSFAAFCSAGIRHAGWRKALPMNENAASSNRSEFYMGGEIPATLGLGVVPAKPG
jgi:hypothetical protein